MMKSLTYFCILAITFVVISCATVVKPTGGARDLTPPEIQSITPASGTTNINTKKIEIEFDEYVVLEKMSEQLVISPPMPDKPKISIRNKSVIIQLPDSLSPNTTYSIFFGNAIVNYKEKVPAENVEYVFSTGAQIDSLFIEGHVVNAEDGTEAENTFVMLYQKDVDSAIYKEKPYYLAKVRPGGSFRLSSLAQGEYQIFALQDLNSNYNFDQLEEKMAFANELIKPYTYQLEASDNDSTPPTKTLPEPMRLSLFSPIAKKQVVTSIKAKAQNQAIVTFRKPAGSINMRPLDFEVKEGWALMKYGKRRDTVYTWFHSLPQDTFDIEISENGEVIDTLTYKYKPKIIKALQYKSNAKNGKDFFTPVSLVFKSPIQKIDASKIYLVHHGDSKDDTLKTFLKCLNPEFKTHFVLETELEETQSYTLFIPDSIIYDIYGNSHDTITKKFRTTAARSYASLKLQVEYQGKHPLVVDLHKDGKRVKTFVVKQSMEMNFPYLDPGKYTLKAVEDRNNNGLWDTGDYDQKRQPEKVLHMDKTMVLKSNWEIVQKWVI